MAAGYAWFLVLGSVFLCNLMKTLLPSISSFVSTAYYACVPCYVWGFFGGGDNILITAFLPYCRPADGDKQARCLGPARISKRLGALPAKT